MQFILGDPLSYSSTAGGAWHRNTDLQTAAPGLTPSYCFVGKQHDTTLPRQTMTLLTENTMDILDKRWCNSILLSITPITHSSSVEKYSTGPVLKNIQPPAAGGGAAGGGRGEGQ